jgi:hypothetical protein
MNRPAKRFLFWTPRIVCILFALLLSLFSLDVFGQGLGFKDLLIAAVMHQFPAVIMIVVLAVAWRWEWVGAVLYAAAGLLYAVLAVARGQGFWTLAIAGPLLLLAVLFLLNWVHRKELRARS